MKTKECINCAEVKSLNEFYKSKSTVDGRYGACKECRKAWQRDYQKRNNSRIVEHHRQYRKGLTAGIYTITNTITGKVYVGESSECIRRLSDHKLRLKRQEHQCLKLQEDYDKHGDVFEYEVVKELPADTDKQSRLQEESRTIQSFLEKGNEVYNKTITKINKG
tara:strand:+ start:2762 stop:3253 length:492 start_codon:yes stop_codon:yes gene_type:complete